MKRILALILSLFLMVGQMTFAVTDDVDFGSAKALDERQQAIDSFNELRTSIGLPILIKNDALTQMASTHSTYMSYNNELTSVENSDLEYYRGRYPWDRATYFDYNASYVYEFVRKDLVNFSEGMEALLEDPLTRGILLDPRYTDIGMSTVDGYYTFVVGGNESDEARYVNYPDKGQVDVPLVWNGDSKDQLYELAGLEVGQVGLPMTESYYGNKIIRVEDAKALLINVDNGTVVETVLLEHGDHYLLENTLTVLPLEPFEPNTHYRLTLSYDITHESNGETKYQPNMGQHYSFYTGVSSFVEVTSPYVTRGEFTEALVRAESYALIEPLELRFTDVTINSPLSRYIYTANTAGLINGFPDNTFGPELNITKEQAYTILIKAYEKRNGPILLTALDSLEFNTAYMDQNQISSWASDYVLKASKIDIVRPKAGEIKPGAYLTEEDFLWIINQYKEAIKPQ